MVTSLYEANGHLTIGLLAKPGQSLTGVGRYVNMLEHKLRNRGVGIERVSPWVPRDRMITRILRDRLHIDVPAFLSNYPVWAAYPETRVLHVSSQNLASLLMIRKPSVPTIVTVHDIIPYLLRDNPDLTSYRGVVDRRFDALAMRGLRRADYIVADSEFTRQSLIRELSLPGDRIGVVHLGIDHQRFRPTPPLQQLLERYQLPAGRRFLIYVGSEDPRKNLKTLLNALALVHHERDDVDLIKVGRPHNQAERASLISHAERIGIRHAIHFLEDVPESDLPALYSLATICVMPSLYEGFGFPVLESMACGTPVVCSNAASLPELAGDAALQFAPGADSHYRLALAINQILADQALERRLKYAGFEQAARFTWEHTTDRTLDAYARVTERKRSTRRLFEIRRPERRKAQPDQHDQQKTVMQ